MIDPTNDNDAERLLGWPYRQDGWWQRVPGGRRAHRAGSRVKMALRSTVSFARARPTFLVIGEQKCGTSALYAYLMQNPAALGYWNKEVHYFDKNLARGERWYGAHFPLAARAALAARRAGCAAAVGEASATYLFPAHIPALVRAYDPTLRLLVLVREPVERAHSHYRMRRRLRGRMSFREAVEPELAGGAGHELLARGRYVEPLERWLACFPAEQLLVLASEELRDAPLATLNAAERFLGLPPSAARAFPPVNANPSEPLPPELHARLEEHFREPNRRLFALLGRDLGWPS